MATKEHSTGDDQLIVVEQSLSRAERYIEENKKSLVIIFLGILLVVTGYLGFKKLYVAPKEEDAASEMFMAQRYFEQDSFKLALNGDNNYVGFLYIIENYGFTKAANLANYYAGVSYLHLGEWEKAIEYLKEFDSSDRMVWALSVANIGDAYVELGKYSDAITYYKKAANTNKNEFTTPVFMMKLAFAHNLAGEKDKALEVYKDVKEKYPKSAESVQAEKYIARLQ